MNYFTTTTTSTSTCTSSRKRTMTNRESCLGSSSSSSVSVSASATWHRLDRCSLSSSLSSSTTKNVVLFIVAASIAIVPTLVSSQGFEPCYICPNDVPGSSFSAAGGIRGRRELNRPSLQQMISTIPNPNTLVPDFADGKSTCAYLQETLQDVNSMGFEGQWCFNNQWLACLAGCCSRSDNCMGEYVDPNPSCDLCGTPPGEQPNAHRGVPPGNMGRTTSEYKGIALSCEGLYDASAELNMFPASECPAVQRTAGRACCNLPDSPVHATGSLPIPSRFQPGGSGTTPAPPSSSSSSSSSSQSSSSSSSSSSSNNNGGGGGGPNTPLPIMQMPQQSNGNSRPTTGAGNDKCGEEYYREMNPTVARDWPGDMWSHFRVYGECEGRVWKCCPGSNQCPNGPRNCPGSNSNATPSFNSAGGSGSSSSSSSSSSSGIVTSTTTITGTVVTP